MTENGTGSKRKSREGLECCKIILHVPIRGYIRIGYAHGDCNIQFFKVTNSLYSDRNQFYETLRY